MDSARAMTILDGIRREVELRLSIAHGHPPDAAEAIRQKCADRLTALALALDALRGRP
jgi:hypothetical protein